MGKKGWELFLDKQHMARNLLRALLLRRVCLLMGAIAKSGWEYLSLGTYGTLKRNLVSFFHIIHFLSVSFSFYGYVYIYYCWQGAFFLCALSP